MSEPARQTARASRLEDAAGQPFVRLFRGWSLLGRRPVPLWPLALQWTCAIAMLALNAGDLIRAAEGRLHGSLAWINVLCVVGNAAIALWLTLDRLGNSR